MIAVMNAVMAGATIRLVHCGVTEHRWGLRASPDCSCGQLQTMLHIVEQCTLTRLEGGLRKLNSGDDDATAWLGQVRIR